MYKIVSARKLVFDKFSKRHLWTFDEDHFIGLSLKDLEGFFEIQTQNGFRRYNKIKDFKYKNERFVEYKRENLGDIEELLIQLKKHN